MIEKPAKKFKTSAVSEKALKEFFWKHEKYF